MDFRTLNIAVRAFIHPLLEITGHNTPESDDFLQKVDNYIPDISGYKSEEIDSFNKAATLVIDEAESLVNGVSKTPSGSLLSESISDKEQKTPRLKPLFPQLDIGKGAVSSKRDNGPWSYPLLNFRSSR